MPVGYGEYDGEPEIEGTLVAEDGDAWLISDTDLDADEVHIDKIDNEPGRLRLHAEERGEIEYTDMEFDTLRMARLAFGLWKRCGPFVQPEGRAVPIEVARDGQAAIGAYLRIGNGFPNTRSHVADQMGVTEQTVSNYCNRIRWKP